jgi:hypothetical protein
MIKEIKIEKIATLENIADFVRAETDEKISPSLAEVFHALRGGNKGIEKKIRKIVEKDPVRASS